MMEEIQKIMETPDPDKMIRQKIYRNVRTRNGNVNKVAAGDLVAGIINNELVIGYSLCHKQKDRYDCVKVENKFKRLKGYGKKLAILRAIDLQHKSPTEVNIPASIASDLVNFIFRCNRYYKGRHLVPENYTTDQLLQNMKMLGVISQ